MWPRALALALLPAVLAQAPAYADPACEVVIKKLRFDDEVTCRRDPASGDGLLDRLKRSPIERAEAVTLSLGGEARQRYEFTRNPLFGEDPQDEAGVWLQRTTLHGDLQLGPHGHARVLAGS